MEHYLALAARTVFVENLALSFFLGMCSFLAVSRKVETAVGLGAAVILVLGVQVLASPADGGWYPGNGFLTLAPSAALLIGCFIWLLRSWRPEQIEEEMDLGALPDAGGEDRIR